MAETMKVAIEGMSCNHCVQTIEKGLVKVPGVQKAEVDLKAKQATLTVEKNTDALRNLVRTAISDLGYEAGQ